MSPRTAIFFLYPLISFRVASAECAAAGDELYVSSMMSDPLMPGMMRMRPTEPDKVRNAPYDLPIRRPNEVLAARKPILTYKDYVRESAPAEPAVALK